MKSRKLWFMSFWGVLFTVMQYTGHLPIDGNVYSNLMTIVLAAYAAGNVGEHFANRQ